ncbi:putative glucose dehydrogenase [Stachybotrys elegans]|uniref:Glucose dehydrogenase n=1 Tax=Stachybotrys elegans TaxID=80388 RepID=A0A8K0SNR1_9HYPO|nr:putative glucose dehydrogenase [Stachybotrys elegans]
MPIHQLLPDDIAEVDIIISGGGTAGCIVAARLAQADPTLSILVVEGGSEADGPDTRNPALYRANLAPGCPNLKVYVGEAEKQLLDRQPYVGVGNVLGGGSSVNALIYTRASSTDYDSWQAEGWSGDEVLPFLKKFENYDDGDESNVHGSQGPVWVSTGKYKGAELADDFIQATAQTGCPEVKDVHDFHTAHGVSVAKRYVSPHDGGRQGTFHVYLDPLLQTDSYPNLHVVVRSQVKKALLDATQARATGIVYQTTSGEGDQDQPVTERIVRARRMVILTAGALGSPTILERSGIGHPQVLERAGISLLHKLPGVGNGFQDHHSVGYTYHSKIPMEDSFESIHNGHRDVTSLIDNDDPLLSWNGVDAFAKLRPTEEEVDSLGPAFRQKWDKDFRDVPTKPLVGLILFHGFYLNTHLFPVDTYFTIGSFTSYPYSRGHIHVTGPSLNDPVNFKAGYLSDEGDFDLTAQVWAYKKQRQIVRKMKSLRGEISHQHPSFAEGSNALCPTTWGAAEPVENTVDYTDQDDDAIQQFLRGQLGTTFHPLGTCRMGPADDELAVVDHKLSVHGISGLKIADLSIAPLNVGVNTMSTALLIGEKAADIFIRELAL